MYKNALKEDLIRVVENLDGTVESTDTIVKLKTKIENSSTFESDPDFVKTLIQNCIDERVSQNERERRVEVKPINISLNQHSTSLSVRTAISPTLTEEFIIHPSVYSEIEKLGHAKSDVLLNESESSLGVHAYAYPNVVSFSNVPVSILCKKANGAMKTSSVEFISRSPNPLPMKSEHRRFVLLRKILSPGSILLWSPWKYRCGQRTVRMAVVACSQNQAVFARRRNELKLKRKLLN
ncbi:hypothetical protein TNCV_1053031 [Trichonephila clavipes]|nr:hypothetical protein TNCV_1053031 [Trichonephila clavipes]